VSAAVSIAAPATAAARIAAEYPLWVRHHDTLSEADRDAIRADIARLPAPPTLSLLLPVGFAPSARLLETLASLRAQLYPDWELCIAGEAETPSVLATLATADPRVRLVDRARHAEPATAAAAALAQAEERHVALLAEGDRLPPHALYEIAVELCRFPETTLLYTDEDRIATSGIRSAPRFKGGWDADLLLAHDYIGAVAVYDRAVLIEAGGPRAGFGAAYGYELALRATARMMPDRIRHLPSVLCHRPADPALTLRERALGPGSHDALLAVRTFLGTAAPAYPAPLLRACHRIVWPLPAPAPPVSVIMPTRDHAELLVPAAWGVLLRTDYPDLELVIVDNDSSDALTQAAFRDLLTQPRVRILRHSGRFNFPAINNAAVRQARGQVVVLLNNDIDVIHADWLRELVSHAIRPDVGAVGAKLLYADGQVQHGGIVLAPGPNATHTHRLADRFDPGYDGRLAAARGCMAVTAACLAIRRDLYLEVGGMDEAGFPVAFNDLDLCLRLGERGYRIVWTPFAELFHIESKTRGTVDTEEKAAQERREVDLLDRLWRQAFRSDPFANPNLHEAWNVPLRLCPPRRARPWQRGGA
jgi:GT2 family glycosyltransferase